MLLAYAFLFVGPALFVLYTLSQVVRRLLFHPLRKFPGPKLAAATYLYEAYFDLWKDPGGQFTYHLDDLHDRYGPIIRCSPDEIHVRDSSWYGTLYAGPGHVRDKWERSNRANNAPGSVASASPHELHRSRRSALNPFFAKRSVNELETSISEKVQKLCLKLHESARTGEIVNLGAASTAVTLDVISEYCFGHCQNALSDPDYGRKWKDLMQGLFEGVPLGKHFPAVVQLLQSLPRSITEVLNPVLIPFFEMQGQIDTQARMIYSAEEKADQIRALGENELRPKTIFHGILQSNLPIAEKSPKRMSDEAFVLVVAGGETTAQVVTVTLSHLIRRKELYMRLRRELDSVYSNRATVPGSGELEQIPLMKAIAQEGLRIAAPVSARPQLISPIQDLQYRDWIIPRGTPTSMTHRNVLFDPEIFPEPHEFKPERWMQKQPEDRRLDNYLVSFGKGVRSCVGMSIAWAEIYAIIGAIVWQFDLELVDFDQKRDLEIVRDGFVGLPSKASRGVRVSISNRT